jgi:hypothetical protein
MGRDQIFVSYSHRDKRWLHELLITLKPLVRKRKIDSWDDTKINIGAKWRAEIESALSRAKVAILLVSRNFLYSDFISESELPPLLDAAKEDGLVIVWIAIGYSSYEQTEIADYQAANDPSRPLNSLSESEVDFELVRIAKEIDRILEPTETSGNGVNSGSVAPIETASVVSGGQERSEPQCADEGAREKIRQALAEGKWAWRSVEALAAKAALSSQQTLQILRRDPEIELGRSKSGRSIARLRTRVP